MDRQNGNGLFENVIRYNEGLGYGNDVLEEPVRPWDETHLAQYAEFVGRLVPHVPQRD